MVRIVTMKKILYLKKKTGKFYEIHKERPFYNELVGYMSGGPIIAQY